MAGASVGFMLPEPYVYWAFIAYTEVDRHEAVALHRRLERYRVPKSVGVRHGVGGGRSLRPIFLDREEMPASGRVEDLLYEALDTSRALVVVTSPATARSAWVSKEVTHVLESRSAEDVIVVVVDGDLGDRAWLPEPLRRGSDLKLLDARNWGAPRRRVRLQIVARLLGVGFDELWQRHRRRRAWVRAWAVLVAALLLVASSAVVEQGRAARERDREHAALLQKAEELRRIATGTSDRSVRDRSLQNLLLLAGSDLADQAGETATAADILGEAVGLPAGTVEDLRTDIGTLFRIDDLGSRTVASSRSGRIALLDPTTGAAISVYVEPPGVELISQRLPHALAVNPRTDVLAALTRAGDGGPQHLVHLALQPEPGLNRSARMQVLGEAHVGGPPVSALTYRPSGEWLLGASSAGLVLWAAHDGRPTEAKRCWFPTNDRGSEPTEIILDNQDTPTIVFADGQVVRVGDAWIPADQAGVQGPCAVTELLPPDGGELVSAAGVSTDDDAGAPTGGMLVASAAENSRTVRIRQTGSDASTSVQVADGPPIDAIDLRSDGERLAVARDDEEADPTVEIYDVATRQLEDTFPGYGTPMAYGGPHRLLANEDGTSVIGKLNDEAIGIPGRGISTTYLSNSEANAVVAGRTAFATIDLAGSALMVHRFHQRRPSVALALPGPWFVPGGGQFGQNFDVNDDGTLVAAELERGDGRRTAIVSLWDVDRGEEIALPDPGVTSSAANDPMGVRFLPGRDAFVVAYRGGDLVRFDRDGQRWRSRQLVEGVPGRSIGGMEVDTDRVTLLSYDSVGTGWQQRVVRVSPDDGVTDQTWDVTALGVGFGPSSRDAHGFVIPLAGGEVLLVESGGTLTLLGADGRDDDTMSVDAGTLLGGVALPDGDGALLAGTDGTVSVATDGVLRRHPTASSIETPFNNAAVTDDGRFLFGIAVGLEGATIAPLRAADRRADMCFDAGRDLTRAEWAAYVGDVADYRPLCSREIREQTQRTEAIRELDATMPLAALSSPRTEDADRDAELCDADTSSENVTAASHGALSWAIATHDELSDGLLGVVCVDGDVRWLMETLSFGSAGLDARDVEVHEGGTDGHEAIAISMPLDLDADGRVTEAVDVITAAGQTYSARLPNGAVETNRDGSFTMRYASGALAVRTTVAPIPGAAWWGHTGRVPDGPAAAMPVE